MRTLERNDETAPRDQVRKSIGWACTAGELPLRVHLAHEEPSLNVNRYLYDDQNQEASMELLFTLELTSQRYLRAPLTLC